MLRVLKRLFKIIYCRYFSIIFAVEIKHRAGKNRAGSEWAPPIAEVRRHKGKQKIPSQVYSRLFFKKY